MRRPIRFFCLAFLASIGAGTAQVPFPPTPTPTAVPTEPTFIDFTPVDVVRFNGVVFLAQPWVRPLTAEDIEPWVGQVQQVFETTLSLASALPASSPAPMAPPPASASAPRSG